MLDTRYWGRRPFRWTLSSSLSGNCRQGVILEHPYSSRCAGPAIGGTSAEHLSSFVTWLGDQQYSAGYACIGRVTAFGRWCGGCGIEVEALTDDDIERFQRSRARVAHDALRRAPSRQALTLLLLFLRERGLFTAAALYTTAVDRRHRLRTTPTTQSRAGGGHR